MPQHMATSLVAKAVTLSFGGVRALDEAFLELGEGSWTGLIGPNGSGKSTLLNVLSGVNRPQGGEVLLHGESITRSQRRARARLGIARTFQHPQLADTLTIAENVDLGRDLRRRRSSGPVPATADILDLLGILGHGAQLPAVVPYGVRKLAEVARAIASGPSFLLLDEPAAGLSAAERSELIEALGRLRERRPEVAVCLVEHDVALVSAVVDQVVVLDVGRVLTTGATAEVFADPRVRDVYLGRAAGGASSGHTIEDILEVSVSE
jgi:branched-chain amino acid transport system ATP-binding protein